MLMKTGGKLIYSGPLGQHSQNLIDYFEVSFTLLFFFLFKIILLFIENECITD